MSRLFAVSGTPQLPLYQLPSDALLLADSFSENASMHSYLQSKHAAAAAYRTLWKHYLAYKPLRDCEVVMLQLEEQIAAWVCAS